MFAKKKIVQLLAGLLVVTCLSVFVVPKIYYAIVDRGKNNYLLATTDLDPKKVDMTGVMLTIKVDNPQKETILLTSSEPGVLGGDNISTFYKARHPELAGRVEIVNEGIKLRLKASDKPVTLKLPIEIPYSIKTTFDIRRGKRSISKNKVSFTEKKPDILEESPAILKEETPEITPPSGLGQVVPTRRQKVSTSPSLNSLSFKNPLTKPSPRLLGSGGTGKDPNYKDVVRYVSNEDEMRWVFFKICTEEKNYYKANVIIKLTADISVNQIGHLSAYMNRGKAVFTLGGYETTYTIDGQGHTLNIGPKIRNMPVFLLLTPEDRPPKATTIENMTINYGGTAPGKESVLVYIPANESNTHIILLQDIKGVGRKQGRLVYAPHATTLLRGDVEWYSDAAEASNDAKFGLIYSSEISVGKTDDGQSPNIDLTNTWDVFKSQRGAYSTDDGKYDTIVGVRAGRISLTSTWGSAIYMNSPSSKIGATFEVVQGAQLTCRTKNGAAAIAIYSENQRKRSRSIISSGAKVVAINDNGGTAFFHRVKEFGTLRITGSGTKLTVRAGESQSGTSSALHFSLVGHQRLRVEDKAEVVVTKEKGRSAAIRFTGPGNEILISGGGVLTVRNLGRTGGSPEEQGRDKVSDGGDAYGGQGILFTDGLTFNTRIRAQGEGSRIDVKSEIGPALETYAEAELTLLKYTRGSFVGRTASSEVGAVVFRHGVGKINLTKAAFRFRNNHTSTRGGGKATKTVGGRWISGPWGSRWKIPFKADATNLQVWKRDPKVSLDGEPSKRWGITNFVLQNEDWNTVTSSNNPNFRREYGKSSDYAQITGEGFKAEVEKIRQPTNADKRIYGHVEIPLAFPVAGGKQMRDADTDEVWVTLKLYRLKLKPGGVKYDKDNNSGINVGATYDVVTYEKEVPTIGRKGMTGENKDLDGVRQFGEPKTYGIFEWDLSKDQTIKRDKGDPFLWAGEYVEVIRIRRGGKKPNNNVDIISTAVMQNQGKYVFNVRPVEVSSYALVDPVLGKLPAKPQVSDATKEIELGIAIKKMRRHMALVPLDVIEKSKDDQQKAKLKDIVTGWSYAAYNLGGKFGYLPMLTTGQETTVDPVGSENGRSKIAAIELSGSDKQAAFLRPRTYLTADQTTANQPSELFVMSGWGDDISSLGKDLPPTYQKVSSLTTRDTDELSHQVTAFWASISDKRELTGLKMPTKKTAYHDAEFGSSPKLNLTPVVPKELAIDLTRKGRGAIDQVDITGSQLVTYQLKLTNPNLLATPTEMLMGYWVTFTVTGLAEVVDTLDLILPDGVSETHTAKSITFTSKGRRSLGETVRIPLAVVGDFEMEVKGEGRTPQEKTYAMPRGIWNIDGEQHNAYGDPFWLHQPLPPADDLFFRDYYHLLKAPDQKVSVKVTRDNVKHPVYLSIRDNQLTVYYRQLKSGSQVTVTVDGKKLTTFTAEGGTTEQAKPLDLKVNGLRSIVKVSYTTDKEQSGSVTWKNPKLAAE
ncbi:hypothetical protein GYN67_04830 [Lactococcus piscium]|uniref:hypothetical protein n=1 Tax=Pseudolactococcus carnosus TaxID=2749961 RepID=UPI001FBBEB43|nr:hypothetical protein [Lactococcus carnosus]MCJ1996004.1 hypothetical protein [Lactococcus carnosus]